MGDDRIVAAATVFTAAILVAGAAWLHSVGLYALAIFGTIMVASLLRERVPGTDS